MCLNVNIIFVNLTENERLLSGGDWCYFSNSVFAGAENSATKVNCFLYYLFEYSSDSAT